MHKCKECEKRKMTKAKPKAKAGAKGKPKAKPKAKKMGIAKGY